MIMKIVKILENDNNNTIKNEFIFVSDEFFKFLNIKIDYDKMKVLVNTENRQIIFDSKKKRPNKKLSFIKKESDIYQFIPDKENKKLNVNKEINIEKIKLYSYFSRSKDFARNKNLKYGEKFLLFFDYTKAKLNDIGEVIGLTNDKIGVISYNNETGAQVFKIYETKEFKIISKIESKEEKIINGKILDNNDLILLKNELLNEESDDELDNDELPKYHIEIYKLKNENYNLFQKIDDYEGYNPKETIIGCRIIDLDFKINNIIKLSNKRFISISSYGFKIYSLIEENDKYEYKCSLLNAKSS